MASQAREMVDPDEVRRTGADRSYVGTLVRKWGRFLEGMPVRTDGDRYTLGVTAMLMENEAGWLKSLNEETRTTNVGAFTKFIFPILRRVFPNLIANEIVSVQPMTAPVGAVFYLNYLYDSAKGPTSKGGVFPRDFDKDYSSEFVNGEILATGDGVKYGGAGAALAVTLAYSPIRPKDSNYSVVIAEVHATSGAIVQRAVDDGSGGFTGAVGAGALDYTSGALTAFKFTNAVALNNRIKAYYTYNGELNSNGVPQVRLDVVQAPVEARPRRLKAIWSAEAAEDLKAFQGLDAETEMVSAIAQEIALEIDREIISELFAASTGTTGAFDRVPPAAIAEIDHLRSLLTVIATVANTIHKKTLRAPANFLVTSPDVTALVTQLMTHADYRPIWQSGNGDAYGPIDMPRPMQQHGQYSIFKLGTLNNKWMVYEDPFFTRDMMLVGLKGSGFLDAGYAWAPYVPLQITQTFQDPHDFSLRKGLRTRYGKKLLRTEYYGQIRISNL